MRRILTAALLALVIAVSSVYALDLPLDRALANVMNPLGSGLQQAGSRLRSAAGELPRVGRLQTAVREAESEVTRLRLELVRQQRLEEENRQLRQELEFARDYEPELLAAEIINYQPVANRDFMRIAAGSNDGLEAGMPVISQGVLLGKISNVEPRYSNVMLLSDVDFRALVDINGASGVLRGQVGGGIVVERLERNPSASEGDIVVSSGRDGIFPPDLLVGSIRSLREDSGNIFDTANVDSEVDPRDLQVVMVLKE